VAEDLKRKGTIMAFIGINFTNQPRLLQLFLEPPGLCFIDRTVGGDGALVIADCEKLDDAQISRRLGLRL